MLQTTETRYIVEVDAVDGWTAVDAFFYLTDAKRWAKHLGLMVDDKTIARIIRRSDMSIVG